MFKITKDKNNYDMYVVECHLYDVKSNSNKFLYRADNLNREGVVQLMQGRTLNKTDISIVFDVLNLTKCPALISDTGELSAVPVVS